MLSFLLKSICCILIINVTFCRSCFTSVCKARCYFKHSGFDFGYCEKGICKCAPPVIYVFDGIGRDLSDEYIKSSLVNNNVIQNSITSRPSASATSNYEDKKNKQKKIGAVNVNSKNAPVLNEAPNLPPPKATATSTQASPKITPSPQIVQSPQAVPSPQATPKTVNKITLSTPRNAVPNKNNVTNSSSPKNSITGANPNKKQNSNPKVSKQTPKEEDNKNHEILVELSEESVEDDESQSGSESYELSEEENSVATTVGTSNK